jgi:predicted protein tyrosine phosphatase
LIEIHPQLFVGSESDYEMGKGRFGEGWAIVHACKEPYHRQVLGYSGRAAPKSHPEYLIARRGNRLILNLVDAADPAYIPDEIMDSAIAFIHAELSTGQRVLVHCNQGLSRSPGIAMLYLATHTDRVSRDSFESAVAAFRAIYPPFAPAPGIAGWLFQRWARGLRALVA